MKNNLRLMLSVLLFSVFMLSISNIYANDVAAEFEAAQNKKKEEVKASITKKMTDNFKTTKLYKKVLDTEKKRDEWVAKNDAYVKDLAKTDPKYEEFKNLYFEISDCLFKNFNPDRALAAADEALAIKEMSYIHYLKLVAYSLKADLKNVIAESEKVDEAIRPFCEGYYMTLGNAKHQTGDIEGAKKAFSEGVEKAPSRELFEDMTIFYKDIGDKKAYEENKKIALTLFAIIRMGY